MAGSYTFIYGAASSRGKMKWTGCRPGEETSFDKTKRAESGPTQSRNQAGPRDPKPKPLSFRQSDFPAKSAHPQIALKQGEFGICQCSADPKGTRGHRDIERCECSILIA
jgi:hypothetical protein